jgi:hypothetical protein
MIQKFNTLLAGLIIGVLLPSLLYYFFVMPTMRHYTFIGTMYGQLIIKMLPIFLSRCIFPNALLFFLLLWGNLVNIAKGVLISTVVMTAALMVINFLL